eukprot:310981_1
MCLSVFTSCFSKGNITATECNIAPKTFNSGQNDIITTVCAIDDSTFISGNMDGELFRIDWISNHKDTVTSEPHTASITSLIYNQKDQYFISSSRDKSIRLWDASQLEQLSVISNAHNLSVVAMDQNTNNNKLWSGGRDTFIKLWDVTKCKTIFSNQIHRNIPQYICVNNHQYNSNLMIQCCEDLKLRIWDDREGNVIQTIDTGPNIPLCCDIATNGINVIVSFNGFEGNGCELKMYDNRKWNDRNYSEIWTQNTAHQHAVTVCKFVNSTSATNLQILSGSKDETLKLWEIYPFSEHHNKNQNHTSRFTLQLNEPVNDISVIDDIAYIASNNGIMHVLKLSTDFEKEPHIIAIGS